MSRWLIVDLEAGDEEAVRRTATLLVEGFKDNWPDAWPKMDAAQEEVRESFGEGRISRVAVELHPLVVRPDLQRRGIGRALVADLEERVRERGGLTIWLGTDDETGMTTLSGVDLYPSVLEHLANIKNLRGHPYEFYSKVGFSLIGAMPDANGFGKPDIYMAKRVGT
jgi:aminoglycoside 6'-N-acetyltransferase I